MNKFKGTRRGLQSIDQLIDKLVTPISQRQGFARAAILLDWPKIVGANMQQFCQPIKVTFAPNQRSHGKLHVRVPSAMAQQVTYLEPMILERINSYFGYSAVSRLILHQQPVFKFETVDVLPKPPMAPELPPVKVDIPGHPELAEALGKLGRHF